MARNDTVTRILKVIHFLEVNPQGLTAKELKQKLGALNFEASERTIYRDLEAIELIHLPLVKSESIGAPRYKLESIASINQKLNFSYQELIALYLARESMTMYQGSSFFRVIDQFFQKLEKGLGLSGQKELLNIQGYIGFKPQSTWYATVQQDIMDAIYDACAEGQCLEINYKSKSGANKDQLVPRLIGPEGLYFVDSGAYLVGKDLNKNEFRTYSITRIAAVKQLDQPYESSLSLKEYLKTSIGLISQGEIKPVKIKIQDPIASYVAERCWHESQSILKTDDGIILNMNVNINSELARWVLSLGSYACVHEPIELKNLIISELNGLMDLYEIKKAA